MKRLLAVALISVSALATAADPPAKPDAQALHEAMMKLAQLGPQHERFKEMAGQYDCVCRNYEGDPTKPQEWKATSTFKPLFGGRYLQQEFAGEMPGGLKYSGQGLMAYDNAQQKYVGTWIDTMSTGIMETVGTYDEATRTMTEEGTAHTPIGEMKFKMTTQIKSPDQFVFTMAAAAPEGEQKMMEIEYTRKK
jgi:hypothetical protein